MQFVPRLSLVILALAALALGAAPPQATAAPGYTIIDLGTLGGERSAATAVNKRGEVVGWADTGEVQGDRPVYHAFLWDQEQGMRDLSSWDRDAEDEMNGVAQDLNDRGEVVGWFGTSSPDFRANRAFLWQSNTGMRPLPQDSSSSTMSANGINNRGVIVGDGVSIAGTPIPVLWRGFREMQQLQHSRGSAQAVNDRGTIAGWDFGNVAQTEVAVTWPPRRIIARGPSSSVATDIDSRGSITGSHGLHGYPFLYRNGQLTALPIPEDRTSGEGLAIWKDTVVGVHWNRPSNGTADRLDERAFIWQRGRMRDLNELLPPDSGWHLTAATDVHGSTIVGRGLHNGVLRAFLLKRQQ